MPFRSEAQRRFLWAKHPVLAKRWAHEPSTATEKKRDLPYHVKKTASVVGVLSVLAPGVQKLATAYKPEPGDIIVMSPRTQSPDGKKPGRLANLFLKKLSPKAQGPLTHAALVVHGGRVVESRIDEGITKKTFRNAIKGKQYVIKRPPFSNRTKLRAVNFAEKQVGKHYSLSDLMAQSVGTLMPNRLAKAVDRRLALPKERKGFTCSSLISASYGRAKLAPVSGRLVIPADLRYSPKLKDIRNTVKADRAPTLGRLKRKE